MDGIYNKKGGSTGLAHGSLDTTPGNDDGSSNLKR